MKTSNTGIELIKEFESFRSKAYYDQAGVCTIGYGTTKIDGASVKPGTELSLETGLDLLAKDLARVYEPAVSTLIYVPLTQNQFDALVCFTYNVGRDGLRTSTLRRHLNEGVPITERRFTDWNKITVKGRKVVSNGLIRRRKAEYHLFTTGKIKTTF